MNCWDLLTFGLLLSTPIGTVVAGGWFDVAFGWKLNWRLMVDFMVHKQFNTQCNGSAIGEPANRTKGLSLLDLMLQLNSVQQEQEG